MNNQLIAPQAPVTDEELDQMIWKLERDGMTPKMLSLMRELRDVRRASAEKLNQPVSETELLPPGYLLGHQDGREWAAQMAEANHPQTGDWLHDDPIALAAAIRKGPDMPLASGNSPATPDGWQLVPKEPTVAMNKAGWAAINEHDEINPTYRAMLAAAPQQDVRLALEIGMSRYAGAMQKLVDSGD